MADNGKMNSRENNFLEGPGKQKPQGSPHTKVHERALVLWVKPVTPGTWEAEFRTIMAQGHKGQIVLKTPTPK
jgi:hypothetical protein